jgi:catechol 2,3-dioxygenase-like lactoylglutathione lyase family enzyme
MAGRGYHAPHHLSEERCHGTTHWRPDAAGGGLRRGHRLLHPGNGLRVLEDTPRRAGQTGQTLGAGRPKGAPGSALLLARAANEEQRRHRSPGGGRVFLFLETDDFWGDYERMQAYGVHFCEQPRLEPYGTVVVFEDISGNRWDLLQLAAAN